MMLSGLSLAFAPLLPWAVLFLAGAVGLILIAYSLVRLARGSLLRLAALAIIWLALANPSIVSEQRQIKPDIGLILVDDSASQSIGDRQQQTERVLQSLLEQAKTLSDLEIRVVRAGGGSAAATANDGTKLFEALDRAMADIPRHRYAGTIMITDGQVHDVPAEYSRLQGGPLHALITGRKGEVDRRLVIVRAPAYGLVEKPVTMTIKVEDSSGGTAPINVTLKRDGQPDRTLTVEPNKDTDVDVPIDHGGQTIVELDAEPGPQELTLVNNHAVVAINGIRDRLRVLLISGEPHPGERTWRNLLKADPSVDLVHFTILRPPEKQDGTPINELSLIAFPIRELFEVKLNDFDLIIFDRYRRRNIVPRAYLQAVADYVENGGAILEAAGPSYASNSLSLFYSPLGSVLPGEPTGKVFERKFKAKLTETGRRHPVTAGLDGAGKPDGEPDWGSWFRHVEVIPRRGQVVMSGADDQPLVILDRVGKGRVAQIASDHIWLWSRGFEGGGPQAELLRRVAHWLMKEPQLEEEDLKAEISGDRLIIHRRSLTPGAVTVTVTDPLGTEQSVELADTGEGDETGMVSVSVPGLYRIKDAERTALVAVGAVNPKEYSDVRATGDMLASAAQATGGGVSWMGDGKGPELRRVGEDRTTSGRDWIGLVEHRDYDVTGIRQIPLLPGLVVLLLGLGALMLAWRREGR